MDQEQLLAGWQQYKLGLRNYYQLEEPFSHEHVFRKPTNHLIYAAVRFDCTPAASLSFDFTARWPESLSQNERSGLEKAIGCALVEELFSAQFYPYSGCKIVLASVGWDDVGSSEAAFFLATKQAMREFVVRGRWKLVTPGYAGS
jgi:hypothetical protein